MKKFLIISCLFLALSVQSQSTFFRDATELINPATAAFENSFSTNMIYGINGLFENDYLDNALRGAASKKLSSINSGLGLTFGTGSAHLEDFFDINFNSLGVNYNYQWKLDADSKVFSLGLRPQISNRRLTSFYTDMNGNLSSDMLRHLEFNMAFGAAFKTKQLFLGLSVFNLPFFSNNSSGNSLDFVGANFIASYEFYLNNVRLLPAANIFINDIQNNTTINLRVKHDSFWWQPGILFSDIGGLSGLRTTISGAFGYQFNERFNVGLSADYNPNGSFLSDVLTLGALLSYRLN